MVLEAHYRALAYFGGPSKRIIYDNPKTIVHRILSGKERNLNKRFARMASHYLFEPVMCNPASGCEKDKWRIRFRICALGIPAEAWL